MRKAVALALIVCMFGSMGLYAADSMEGLTYEQQREYFDNALSIETESHTTVSGGAYDWGRPGGFISSYAEGDTSTEWIPYKGARELSKADFFDITGYSDLAEAQRKADTFNRNMDIAGWSLYGVGLAVMLSSLFFLDNETVAYSLLGTGAVVGLCGLPLVLIETENNVSISFAVNIANSYNQRLLDSVR